MRTRTGEYLILSVAYVILAIAKKEVVSKWYTKQKPQRSDLWGFFRLVVTVVSV